jgi:hypothetical protein
MRTAVPMTTRVIAGEKSIKWLVPIGIIAHGEGL